MLLIGKNGNVEHVKRNGYESIAKYLTPTNTKRAPLTLHELNFRVNVIKMEAIFLLKENYF